MDPRISILLPIYNGERFIEEQIRSILSQTFSAFELLVIDDGSLDRSMELVSRIQQTDRRIRVISSTGNSGHKARLYQLFRESTGDFIAISDQDDIWDHSKIEALVSHIGNASLAFGRSELVDADAKPYGKTLLQALQRPVLPADRLSLLLRPMVSAHAALIRRDALCPAAFCNLFAFDWLISLEAAFSAGLIYVENAVVLHRMHDNNQWNGGSHTFELKSETYGRPMPRFLLRSGQYDQFEILKKIEYLASSLIVSKAVREIFRQVWLACSESWFVSRSSFWQSEDKALKSTITRLLRPLAGSEADWIVFSSAVDTLTSNWRQRRI